MSSRTRAVVAFAILTSMILLPTARSEETPRATIFDLQLGARVQDLLPASRFGELACGNNGGPAMQVLADWSPYWQGYHLYYPHRRQPSPAFAAFVEAVRYRER